jgi:hypothetical protein
MIFGMWVHDHKAVCRIDFDGILGTGLPMSMYTTKTPIDKCRSNVTQHKEFFTFHIIVVDAVDYK